MTNWLSVIIAGLILLVGIITQGIGFAYFIGRIKESAEGQTRLLDSFKEFNQQTIDAMGERLRVGDARFDKFRDDIQKNQLAIVALETGLDGHENACEERQRRNDGAFEAVNRRLDGVTAQLQAISRGELTRIQPAGPGFAAGG